MREFLTDTFNENTALTEVDIKVMLPKQTCLSVKIERNYRTNQVMDILLQTLQIPTRFYQHFGLFETVECNFGNFILS